MGTDIHFFIEARSSHNNLWCDPFYNPEGSSPDHPVMIPVHTRDYRLYRLLAGVRINDESIKERPLFPVRGLPDDCSSLIKLAAKENNWHHCSWLSALELDSVNDFISHPLLDFCKSLRKTTGYVYGEWRYIFGFDN